MLYAILTAECCENISNANGFSSHSCEEKLGSSITNAVQAVLRIPAERPNPQPTGATLSKS